LQQAFDRLIAKEKKMTLGTILLIVLILILVGALPNWPHSRSWGYAPSGVIGLVLVVLLILVLLGQL
jgi:multisubunit Na+/H+ antiporter MnhG subunit